MRQFAVPAKRGKRAEVGPSDSLALRENSFHPMIVLIEKGGEKKERAG